MSSLIISSTTIWEYIYHSDMAEDSPNGFNQDKFLDRLRCVIEVARMERELSGLEVVGALEIVKLEVFSSLEPETDDED